MSGLRISLKHLVLQNSKGKNQNNVWNLLKISNNDTNDVNDVSVFIVNFQ